MLKIPGNERKATEAETDMLDQFAAVNERSKDQSKMGPLPEVGIFFVYENRLLIEGTSVSEAQPYGDFMGHAKGHPAFWRDLQRSDVVPRDVEYDEVARGRVGYDIKGRIFRAFMDKCILEDKVMVDQITRKLNLPSAKTAPPRLDAHYRCPACVEKSKKRLEQEEADWDF